MEPKWAFQLEPCQWIFAFSVQTLLKLHFGAPLQYSLFRPTGTDIIQIFKKRKLRHIIVRIQLESSRHTNRLMKIQRNSCEIKYLIDIMCSLQSIPSRTSSFNACILKDCKRNNFSSCL